MSCPDWNLLVGLRDGRGESAETDWLSAVEHLDSCPSCESSALAADPTLVFRRLGSSELGPAEESAEIDSVRRAVAAMRAGRRLERSSHAAGAARHARQWRRYAAAAVLAAAALSLGVDRRSDDLGRMARGALAAAALPGRGSASGSPGSMSPDVAGARPAAARLSAAAIGTIVPASAAAASSAFPSYGEADGADDAMEGLNRPKARVYQLHGRHLQVVMIVDEKLDV